MNKGLYVRLGQLQNSSLHLSFILRFKRNPCNFVHSCFQSYFPTCSKGLRVSQKLLVTMSDQHMCHGSALLPVKVELDCLFHYQNSFCVAYFGLCAFRSINYRAESALVSCRFIICGEQAVYLFCSNFDLFIMA